MSFRKREEKEERERRRVRISRWVKRALFTPSGTSTAVAGKFALESIITPALRGLFRQLNARPLRSLLGTPQEFADVCQKLSSARGIMRESEKEKGRPIFHVRPCGK
ncbi:hypothetical protein V1478_017107 [Vespula squamosa]|uniref:Uncharacterized protein n=1 Tax=Vespula squamosa TaxID=30214 RepID=A0ABD1ZYG2_VESSQ